MKYWVALDMSDCVETDSMANEVRPVVLMVLVMRAEVVSAVTTGSVSSGADPAVRTCTASDWVVETSLVTTARIQYVVATDSCEIVKLCWLGPELENVDV